MRVIGIDPGKSGGLALYRDGKISLHNIEIPEYDWTALTKLLQLATPTSELKTTKVYLEQVTGFIAGQTGTASSMFNFGMGYGYIQGVLRDRGIEPILLRPQVWQKPYNIEGKREARKKALKERATELYPKLRPTLATCDALLILDYGLHHYESTT